MQILQTEDATSQPTERLRFRLRYVVMAAVAMAALILALIYAPKGQSKMGHGVPALTKTTVAPPALAPANPTSDWYAQHKIDPAVADALRECPGNQAHINSPLMEASLLEPCLKMVLKVTILNGVATVETPYGNGATMATNYHGHGVAAYQPLATRDSDRVFAGVVRSKTHTPDAQWGEWQVPANPYSSYLDGIVYELYLCLYDAFSAADPNTYPYDTTVLWEWSQVMPQVIGRAAHI